MFSNHVLRYGVTAILIMSGVALSMGSTGCAAGITRGELLNLMREGNAPVIVDVRSQREYDRDHVPGAVHISFYSIGSGLKEIGFPEKGPVVLYCEHGPRAGIAGFSLFLSGYDKIYSLEGHMNGWRKNEFPIEIITHRP